MKLLIAPRIEPIGGVRGQATVEFALTILLFLTLVFGIVDLTRGVLLYNTVATAAQEGARFGVVLNHDSWGTSNQFAISGNNRGSYTGVSAAPINTIVWRVAEKCAGLDPDQTTVQISWPAASTWPGYATPLTVTVSHPFAPAAGRLVGLGPVTIQASSTMYVEQQ